MSESSFVKLEEMSKSDFDEFLKKNGPGIANYFDNVQFDGTSKEWHDAELKILAASTASQEKYKSGETGGIFDGIGIMYSKERNKTQGMPRWQLVFLFSEPSTLVFELKAKFIMFQGDRKNFINWLIMTKLTIDDKDHFINRLEFI